MSIAYRKCSLTNSPADGPADGAAILSARLLGVFDAQGEIFADPHFHGCAFVSATSETHDERVGQAAAEYRLWVRALFTELAEQAGARSPKTLARQLHLLFDGSSVSAGMDRDGRAADAARAAATVLLDAALAGTV